jgi:hypothetical protein
LHLVHIKEDTILKYATKVVKLIDLLSSVKTNKKSSSKKPRVLFFTQRL